MADTSTVVPKNDTDDKTKKQPPYAVVVLNDDHHTFDYVIEVMTRVFKHSMETATKLTVDIHKEGKRHVWTGAKEHAEMKVELVKNFGEDQYAPRRVDYPLGCYIEPLPE